MSLCNPCKVTGLAMMVALGLPTPKGRGPSLPSWASESLLGLPALQGYQYSLRAPRKGFIYVFHEKCRLGANKWFNWSVSSDGSMYPLSHPVGDFEYTVVQDVMRCTTEGHTNVRLHCIVIEQPHLCGTSWIMFTEKQLSKKARQRYVDDQALRAKRMRSFEPAQLIATDSPSSPCITAASEAALQDVMEYHAGFTVNSQEIGLPYDIHPNNIRPISTKEDGSFDAKALEKHHSTQFPWGDYVPAYTPRPEDRRNAARMAAMLRMRSKKADGTEHPGVMVALPDAVGCTYEMNGFAHDVAGCVDRYGHERELQITAYNAVTGLKLAISQSARKNLLESQRIIMSAAQFQTTMSVQPNPRGWPQGVRHEYLTTQLDIQRYGVRMVEVFPPGHEERKQKAVEEGMKNAVNSEWPKYEPKIDWPALNIFKTNWDSLQSKAIEEQDKRTKELIKWLDAPALQTALNDYHPDDAADGVAFEHVIAQALMGITGCPSGSQKIESWVKEAQAKPSNLLWRALAFNQTETIQALDGLLAEIKQHAGTPLSESAVIAAQASTKHLAKFSDLIKKSLSLHNSLRKDGVIKVPTGGLERLLMTVGERFFQPFVKKGVDTVAEKLVQSMLLVRTGADYTHTMGLVLVEAKFGKAGRTETLLALSMGKAIADKQASAGFTALKQAWANLVQKADTPKTNPNPELAGGFNEARDLRFAMVATLLQGLFAWKLMQDAAKDPKSQKLQAELLAAQLSFGAGVIDLGATTIKGLSAVGEKALSFQALKVGGGVLSAWAGWVAFEMDMADRDKNKAAGNVAMYRFYYAKAYANLAGAGASLLATVSYAAPAMEMLATRFPQSVIARGMGLTFARLFAWRAILMFGGMGLNIAVLGVQVTIWWFSENSLQTWCERSAFGKERKTYIYSTAEIQVKAFGDALQEVM